MQLLKFCLDMLTCIESFCDHKLVFCMARCMCSKSKLHTSSLACPCLAAFKQSLIASIHVKLRHHFFRSVMLMVAMIYV